MSLTPTMKLCLMALEDGGDGMTTRELPGGGNTVAGLMRRGRVEIDADGHVFLPVHEHDFQMTMHVDGCHHYTTRASCSCGVGYYSYGERSLKADPWSAVWMLDDDGETECARCEALVAGAPCRFEVVIQRPPKYTPKPAAAS